MNLYSKINEFSNFMRKKYNAKEYKDLNEALKDFPNLFYCSDILCLTDHSIGISENYKCYIFGEKEENYFIVSYYDDNVIKDIFIPEEYLDTIKKEELIEIHSYLPFYNVNKTNTDEFYKCIKSYNGNFNEENIKKIFKTLYNAKIIEDTTIFSKLPIYQEIEESNRRLKEIGLSPLEIENEKEILFHLEGENIFVPKEEKNCYVLTTFSNDKLISILCSYNRFKWRYELSNLIDSKRVMEILI